MRRIWYRTGFKCTNTILQGIFCAILVLCLANVYYWTEGSFGIREMGKSFEETDGFLREVETIVREKIAYAQNRELFELDGSFYDMQEVDIRQYLAGVWDGSNVNLNTTYYIRDLLAFYSEGRAQMSDRIQRLQNAGLSEQEIGERLEEEARQLETILPISGSNLSDYARVSSNPSTALLEYYQELCQTSADIYRRYQDYLRTQDEAAGGQESNEAPSNVRYYIENTNTKQRYTNLGAKSFPAAQKMIEESVDLDFLYVGERSFNIMVANSEYVLNDEAAQWFIGTRFLGSSEKVVLAVDLYFPIGDGLQIRCHAFENREPVVISSVSVSAICLLLILILLVLAVITAGRREAEGILHLNAFDRIPTEIAAGLCLIAGIIWYFFGTEVYNHYPQGSYLRRLVLAGCMAVEYWILLFSLLSLVRRTKGKILWTNSVCYTVILGSRQVYSARKHSKRLLIAYLVFFALNLFFLSFFRRAGVLMAVVMDMAVLLYLMRDEVGKQSVREGLYQISQGKLDYKINTQVLTGTSREMGEAVNEMGDGLQSAVDSIIKNERLRAELITNVSHDIKTPLTSIINYVDLLKRENIQNEKAAGYIQVLDQKSQRLRQLTEDLIEASKISSGNVELSRMELELQQMLQQAYGEFAERMEEAQLEIVLTLEKDPLVIWADGRQLWRIFENLLGNIVKYAMPGTHVYLELRRMEGLAEIVFKNISGQKLEISARELQERFVRGDLSRNTEGSGLGLSIARSLTEMMDGSFDVDLEGDVFQVTLLFPIV